MRPSNAPLRLKTLLIGLSAILCLVCGTGGPWTAPAEAQPDERLSLFRDAEIEDTIRLYATPLFEAAGLDPDAIEIHLVDRDVLNAFVANGRHLFLFSGLMVESEDPGLLVGVIAHETGHLAAGHLARVKGVREDASAMAILSTVLGLGVVVAGGGEAGAAIAMAGSQIAERSFFGFSRVQESAADQAALRLLDETGQSAEGLRDLMVRLRELEPEFGAEIPYFLTHPLTEDRIPAMDAHIAESPFSGAPPDPDLVDRQKRMVAKIFGFLKYPRETYLRYPDPDESLYALYAWAIAKYRERLMDEALALTDRLIAEEPDNPYFHELRGQMLYETGRFADSLPSHREAVHLAPDEPLLLIALSNALLQLDDPGGWREAVGLLETARRREADYPTTWRLLGLAYGKLGLYPRSNVSRAQMHYLLGESAMAREYASRALQGLDPGSPLWFLADDIVAATGE